MNKRITRAVADVFTASLLVALFFVALMFAQTVRTGDGGSARVTVSVADSSGAVVATTVTDERGNFAFTDLKPGRYVLSAKIDQVRGELNARTSNTAGMDKLGQGGGISGAQRHDMSKSIIQNIRARVVMPGAPARDFTGEELLSGVKLPVEVDAQRGGRLSGRIDGLEGRLGDSSSEKEKDLPGGIVIKNIKKPNASRATPNTAPDVDIIVQRTTGGSLQNQVNTVRGDLDSRAEGARASLPIPGIGVTIRKNPSAQTVKRVADAGGKASFSLAPGSYTLRLDFAPQGGAGGARVGQYDPLVLDLSRGGAGVEITFAADGVTVGKWIKVMSGDKWTGVEVEFTVAASTRVP